MKRFTVLFTIILFIVLTGCQSVVPMEKIEVSATVTEKQYEASHTTLIPTFNPEPKPQHLCLYSILQSI